MLLDHDSSRERERRWRLILGKDADPAGAPDQPDETTGAPGDPGGLGDGDQRMDAALESLYGESKDGDLSDANPDIARWLGDIRQYFPEDMVQLMQRDALQKMDLRKLLQSPNLLAEIEPDVHLVSQILSLKRVMPRKTQESARLVVAQVVAELQEELAYPLQQAIAGTLNRATRTRRPKFKEINWQRTVQANLKHYQQDLRTVIPEKLVGYGRQRHALRDIILCLDQSGSMGSSVVYGSIYAAVMAAMPAMVTRLVAFGSSVVDLSEQLADPVELLFGIQLRGGTNIARALAYCQQLVTRPSETILVLISDLYEGGNKEELVQRMAALVGDGVQVIVLLALNDEGAPRFDRQMAQELVELGLPAFACTPALFPKLMAAAINGRDIGQWAAAHNIVTAPSN
jgi:Mg-chelatase subunit ChlD